MKSRFQLRGQRRRALIRRARHSRQALRKRYHCVAWNCPNIGQYPETQLFSISTFRAERRGDGPAMSFCSLCGYYEFARTGNNLEDTIGWAHLGKHPERQPRLIR